MTLTEAEHKRRVAEAEHREQLPTMPPNAAPKR
jgi:hypothetical protein